MNSYSLAQQNTQILLVDNHAETCVGLEDQFNDPGYSITKVHSSIEALRHLLQKEFALILLHLLPEKNEKVHLIQKLAKLLDIHILVIP